MRKGKWLVMVLLIVVVGLVSFGPAQMTDEPVPCYPAKGCTPGYWKQPQHLESWVGYGPGDSFYGIFGVGPEISLLEAMELKGGGENRFVAHAAAALLNAAHPEICYAGWYNNVRLITEFVKHTYVTGEFDYKKDVLAAFNEAGCPLD